MLKEQARFTGFTKNVKSVTVKFNIQGEPDELELENLKGKKGWVYFSVDEVVNEVEEVMKNRAIGVETKRKSPSQRLRGAIYLYWLNKAEEKGGEIDEFEVYYQKTISRLISKINI